MSEGTMGALLKNGERCSDPYDEFSNVPDEETTLLPSDKDGHKSWLGSLSLGTLGPALVCCLADGDTGSLIVAAQSGSRWNYSLTLVQIMLVPILFAVLEALVRSAVSEKRGFGAMVKAHFGTKWAVFSLVLVLISCFSSIISQMSGIASIAALWGAHQAPASILTALVLIGVVVCCDYRQGELIALFFGSFELVFVFVLIYLHPPAHEIMSSMVRLELSSNAFLRMLAANIGAVVMPWMLYFQQSAVVARRLSSQKQVAEERTQSLLGSILAQLIMVSVMMILAAMPQEARNLDSILGIQLAIQPVFGILLSKILLSMAFFGGSVCAIFVVSLAAAWATCDTLGGGGAEEAFSLDKPVAEAPQFYTTFACIVLSGALVLLACPNVVNLNVHIEVLNALTVPMFLVFLFLVVTGPSMHPKLRIVGAHKAVILVLFSLTSAVAITCATISFLPEDMI